MRSIFKNEQIEQEFRRKGYIIIQSSLFPDVDKIKSELLQMNPDDAYQGSQKTLIKEQSFHITFFDSNIAYKQKMYDFGKSLFQSFANHYLDDYICAQANVFLKPAGKGFVYPHQNITIVDETQFTSLSLWMPLQDTTKENGTICLIPGSHNNQFSRFRNTHIYWPHSHFFKDGAGINHFEPITVKKGEVLILDDRIVHYTPDNTTTEDRWVVHSLWKPSEAELLFFDPKDSGTDVYKVTADFWQFHTPGSGEMSKPKDYFLDKVDPIYSENEIREILDKISLDLS